MTDHPPEPSSEASQGDPKPPSRVAGGEWENAGRVIGRFAGRAGSLFGKAGAVIKSEYKKAQVREGDSALQKIWDHARECVKKGADKENIARLKELASLARENTSDLSGEAAERIARIYTDCTGNPTTAVEVKQAALRFGGMALVTFVTASVLGRAGASQNLFSQVRNMGSEFGAAGGNAGFDGSFEERTAQFYSSEDGEEGTPVVIDADAVVVDLE
ncbi:MAG: hypothetical protein MI807_11260 [Verrucomicrobiales bacterium]|nr:hypothetical protein [Verrucomicrobiales bacterium]